MANNPSLFNAALSGCSGGGQERWITDPVAGNYATFRAAAIVFATEVDAAIPVIVGGASAADAQLLASICQGVMASRLVTSIVAGDYTDIALAIAALFTEQSGALLPSPGGLISPFTFELYVDAGFTGIGDGSIANPYATIQAALDIVNTAPTGVPWAVIVTPGDYTTEDCVINPANAIYVTLRAEGLGTFIKSLDINSGGNVIIQNLGVSNTLNVIAQTYWIDCICSGAVWSVNGNLNIENCHKGMGVINWVPGANANSLTAFDSGFTSLSGYDAIEMYDCVVGLDCVSVIGGSLAILHDTGIGGIFTVESLTLYNSKINGVITAIQLRADNNSLFYIRDIGAANVVTVTINIDNPVTVETFTVPPLVGAFADVAMVVGGLEVNDTIAVTMETQLAAIGIVGAWVSNPAEVTLRFFGTTAGGNIDIGITRFIQGANN